MANSGLALLSRAEHFLKDRGEEGLVASFTDGVGGLEDAHVDVFRLPYADAYELRVSVTCYAVDTLTAQEITSSLDDPKGLTNLVRAKGQSARRRLLQFMKNFAEKNLAEMETDDG